MEVRRSSREVEASKQDPVKDDWFRFGFGQRDNLINRRRKFHLWISSCHHHHCQHHHCHDNFDLHDQHSHDEKRWEIHLRRDDKYMWTPKSIRQQDPNKDKGLVVFIINHSHLCSSSSASSSQALDFVFLIQQTSDFQLKNIPSSPRSHRRHSWRSTCSSCSSKRSILSLPIVSPR